MQLWIAWLATVLFGYFATTSLYAALKPYEKEEERDFDEALSFGEGIFAFMGLFFSFILWISEKLFPERFQLLIFRIVACIIFLFMEGVIYLFWYIYFN